MALRILLVGLVACLGLDWPTAEEFASWRDSGRVWVAARMFELSNLRGEVERAWAGSDPIEPRVASPAAPSPEAISGRVDLAFEAAVEAMTSDFSSDLASMRAKPAGEAAVAAAANQPAQGVSSAVDVESEGEPEVVDVSPTRLERISEAFRLTRQAVDAWASVIRTPEDAGDEPSRDAF